MVSEEVVDDTWPWPRAVAVLVVLSSAPSCRGRNCGICLRGPASTAARRRDWNRKYVNCMSCGKFFFFFQRVRSKK